MDSYSFEYKGVWYVVDMTGIRTEDQAPPPPDLAGCAELLRLAEESEARRVYIESFEPQAVATGEENQRLREERDALKLAVEEAERERDQRAADWKEISEHLRTVIQRRNEVERENRSKCLELAEKAARIEDLERGHNGLSVMLHARQATINRLTEELAEKAGEIRELRAELGGTIRERDVYRDSFRREVSAGAKTEINLLNLLREENREMRAGGDTPQVAHLRREVSDLNRRLADKIERLAKLRVERDEVEREKDAAHRQLAAQREVESELRKIAAPEARNLLALLDSKEPRIPTPLIGSKEPLDPQVRGGHTYIHSAATGKCLFRLTREEHESQIQMLRMAYNSGFRGGVGHAWRWLREQVGKDQHVTPNSSPGE